MMMEQLPDQLLLPPQQDFSQEMYSCFKTPVSGVKKRKMTINKENITC